MSKDGTAPAWDKEAGQGSRITGASLEDDLARSAQNAKGSVDAFVIGTARPGNVFSDVELPTLLDNPNVDTIKFRDPAKPPPAPIEQTWKRGSDGCWSGPAVPNEPQPRSEWNKEGKPWKGFRLHPEDGVIRT
jgi:hypothetical protein